jgi:hypothetical protein
VVHGAPDGGKLLLKKLIRGEIGWYRSGIAERAGSCFILAGSAAENAVKSMILYGVQAMALRRSGDRSPSAPLF